LPEEDHERLWKSLEVVVSVYRGVVVERHLAEHLQLTPAGHNNNKWSKKYEY